jgi:cytochrome P450
MVKGIADLPAVPFSGDDIERGRIAARVAAAAAAHGPIFKWSISDGRNAGEYVFMVGPEANRFVLHTGREHFSHRAGWTPIIGDTLGVGLLNMDPPEHTRHRKLWNPAFTGAAMEAYLPIINRIIAERASGWPEQEEIDAYHEAREITFDAAAAALAGFERGPRVDELRRLFYTLLHGVEPGEGTWDDFWQQASRARDALASILQEVIVERRALPDDAQPRDVLGLIVRARDEDGQPLSDDQLLGHLNILLVAGHETTTTLGAWTLWHLAARADHRERIRGELTGLLGSADAPVTVEALREMRQLDNFIKETGRLYPPVLHVPRGVLSPFEFGGYTIPTGAQVRLAIAGGHRLPQVFADPERFDPDRFAPPREEDRRTPYSLVTFGGGPRTCIGVNFAQIEVKALVAHILPRYDLEPLGEPVVHAGFWTAEIHRGIRLRVHRRV